MTVARGGGFWKQLAVKGQSSSGGFGAVLRCRLLLGFCPSNDRLLLWGHAAWRAQMRAD